MPNLVLLQIQIKIHTITVLQDRSEGMIINIEDVIQLNLQVVRVLV